MVKTRIFAVLLALGMIPFVMTSCNKGSSSSDDSIIVWHWMTDRDEAFKELAGRYKEMTGVDVQFQLYAPSDNYAQKVRVGAQTKNLPEIFGILGESRDLASFVEAGHVENLTPALEENDSAWKNKFYLEALNTAAFTDTNTFNIEPGYYGIPVDVTTIPMIYNRKLFEKAGLDPNQPPQTWAEFLNAGEKLKEIGVNGFVSGWAETWLIYSLFTDLAFNQMGEEKVMKTFQGTVSYTDPDWLKVFEAFSDLQKSGFSDPSLVTLPNKSAEQSFALERSGMTLNGSWAVNVYSGMNENLDYVPFLPPSLNPKNQRHAWGGAGTIFNVNAQSPKKDKAVAFLKWLTEDKQASFLVEKTKNLPAVKNLDGDIPPILKAFSEMMENSIHPNRFLLNEDPKVQEMITKGIQSILINEKTPLQIAESVQKMKKNIMSK